MTGKRKQTSPIGSPSSDSFSKDQDRFLPIANVGRIMKKSLPVNAKISKEAKDTVQACVSEFISFITGEASEKCQREKRKTINGDDLLWAMTTLGFENYVGILNIYLNKYREVEGDQKNTLVRQEDQPLSGVNNFNNGVINEITEADNTIFKDDLNSLGAQVYAKGYGDYGRSIGYGENLVSNGGINMARIYEDGNARRPMATPLHDGAEW